MRDPALELQHSFCRFRDSHTRRALDLRCCVCGCMPGASAWSHVAVERGDVGRSITCSSAYCRLRGRWVARARAWLARPIELGPPRFKADELDLTKTPSWLRYGYNIRAGKSAMVVDDV